MEYDMICSGRYCIIVCRVTVDLESQSLGCPLSGIVVDDQDFIFVESLNYARNGIVSCITNAIEKFVHVLSVQCPCLLRWRLSETIQDPEKQKLGFAYVRQKH